MLTAKNISVVIPNSNGEQLLRKYLQSVIDACAGSEIIIVDDASTDKSIVFIKNKFPNIICIEKKVQEGFSSTVNAGVNKSSKDIVILLNTDVSPDIDFLKYLIPHFNNEKIFAVGCLEESIENGSIVRRGRGEAKWVKGFYIHRKGEVNKNSTAWVSGGSGAFRRSIWQKLGGLDQLYNPFYWEDIDICYRAMKSGYSLVFENKSVVRHYHSKGSIRTQYSDDHIQRIAYRNQFIFIWKNLSDAQLLTGHFFWTMVEITKAFYKGNFNYIIGFITALILIPKIVKNRIRYKSLWKISDKKIILS